MASLLPSDPAFLRTQPATEPDPLGLVPARMPVPQDLHCRRRRLRYPFCGNRQGIRPYRLGHHGKRAVQQGLEIHPPNAGIHEPSRQGNRCQPYPDGTSFQIRARPASLGRALVERPENERTGLAAGRHPPNRGSRPLERRLHPCP